MRWLLILMVGLLVPGSVARATEGSVIKVLPYFLDSKGGYLVSPSLYDRDAYQKYLRFHPAKCSGLMYNVQWKAKAPESEPLKLRVELRGVALGNLPKESTLEEVVHQRHWYSHWTPMTLSGPAYKEFGEVTAWRVTLWDGDQKLGEQKSFLW